MNTIVIIFLVESVLLLQTAADIDVRLVGDRKYVSYGRVEVFLNSTWGTLCSNQWNLDNAHVICRQLGFDGAVSTLIVAPGPTPARDFGQITPALHWLNDFNCTGNENSLSECQHGSWIPVHFCGYPFSQGSSSNGAMCKLQVRLVRGELQGGGREGLVQVYSNNNWQFVCGEKWDKPDADVVCRWMGYQFSTGVFKTFIELSIHTSTSMSNVQCTGGEDSLFACVHEKLGNRSCANHQLAGVKCEGSEVRLSDNVQALNQGHVEVLFNGVWGRICRFYSSWDLQAAHVVCRQLGYPQALQDTFNSEFLRDSGRIGVTDVRCIGNETEISQCSSRPLGWGVTARCDSDDEAGLICAPLVRLVEGPSNREGLVQVYYNETWRWVCDEQWDKQDADVVCRELGYKASFAIYIASGSLQGNELLRISNIQCIGNETSFMSCAHGVWTNVSCGKGQNAGVACAGPEVRLVSSNASLPRVEVLFGGFWGPICNSLGIQPANIVCRELGYENAYAVVDSGQGNVEICLDTSSTRCMGNETSILQCQSIRWVVYFSEGTAVSVICSPAVRIIAGPQRREGIVQVYRMKNWGFVCAEHWDQQDADVVCRELGYKASSEARQVLVEGTQQKVTLMNNVQCFGTESSLSSCPHNGRENNSCAQGRIAGVVCSGPEVRLINAGHNSSPNRGIVEVLFNGVWGRVCSGQSWGMQDAHVTCYQLGFRGAQNAYDSDSFAATEGIAWMRNVNCHGNESALSNCNFTIPPGNLCPFFGDHASVICSPLPHSLGRPAFVFSDSVSILIMWTSSSYANYTVQMWNNKTQRWDNTYCKESMVAGFCTVAETRVLVEDLVPSTTYHFRIYVSKMLTSSSSNPMKTKKLEPPSKPSFVGNTQKSITIRWNPLFLQGVTYRVQLQINIQSTWKDAVCGGQSLVPNQCIVNASLASVSGLKHSTVYRFRLFAVFKEVRSEFSAPSDPLRTQGDVCVLSCS